MDFSRITNLDPPTVLMESVVLKETERTLLRECLLLAGATPEKSAVDRVFQPWVDPEPTISDVAGMSQSELTALYEGMRKDITGS